NHQLSIAETICESVAHAALDLDMRAISVYTETGNTARLISKYRPKCLIYGFSHVPRVSNRLNMFWGVHPVACGRIPSAEDMVLFAERELLELKAVAPGDVMGVVAGTQRFSGSTNFMRLHVIGASDAQEFQRPRSRERRKPARLQVAADRRRRS